MRCKRSSKIKEIGKPATIMLNTPSVVILVVSPWCLVSKGWQVCRHMAKSKLHAFLSQVLETTQFHIAH